MAQNLILPGTTLINNISTNCKILSNVCGNLLLITVIWENNGDCDVTTSLGYVQHIICIYTACFQAFVYNLLPKIKTLTIFISNPLILRRAVYVVIEYFNTVFKYWNNRTYNLTDSVSLQYFMTCLVWACLILEGIC